MSLRKSLLLLLVGASVLQAADIPDAPAPDAGAILQQLKSLKEQQLSQLKYLRDKALREAMASAASPSAATSAWEEAIRETQFEGQPKEGAAFRAWKEKDGDALHDKEVQSAAQLYFRWLVLTLQHSAGKTVKDLLPEVYAYTRDLMADQIAMESFNENIKREEEMYRTGKHGLRPARPHTDQQTRQLHDNFLRGLNGSAPVKALMIDSLIDSVAPAPKKNAKGGNPESAKGGGDEPKADWVNSPGDFDGIYSAIILPELRAMRDPRVLEYWDLRIKRAADAAARTKLAYDAEKFTNEIRPSFLWSRAQELANIGQRNRSISEMFNVLKSFPKHPAAAGWITEIEGLLAPPTRPAPAVSSTSTSAPSARDEPLPGAGTSQPSGVAPLPGPQ
jgi:hypothetical protein